MERAWFLQFLLPIILPTDCVKFSTVDDYLNVCLDGRNHKTVPGPEAAMFSQCAPWKKRSCCTSQASQGIHLTENWLNFDWNHCKYLSEECRSRFIQDLCFYECSPNVGPWIVEDKRKIRNEKFVGVPMCRSECDDWWNVCKNDVTCIPDWSKGFNWSAGINKCPNNKPCQPFHKIYKDSTHFCEAIWGGSWKVVEQGEPCMYLWFDADMENPNDAVAKRRAEQLINSCQSVRYVTGLQVLVLSILSLNLFCLLNF